MRNFDSLYSALITPILKSIFNDRYVGGIFSIDNDAYFIDTVQKYVGGTMRISARRLNHNFPKLLRVSTQISFGNFTLTAGSTEPNTQDGKKLANIKAKGEFLERLSSAFPLDSIADPQQDFTSVLKQHPATITAKKLFSFGSKSIPTPLVYYYLSRQLSTTERDSLPYQPTTNGGAGHFEHDKAVLSGLLELIQRDAFLMYWLNTLSPKKIDVDTYFEKKSDNTAFIDLKQLVMGFKKYKLAYHFLDITSDIAVPAVCCVLISESTTGKRVSVGASAGFVAAENLLSAATEATSVMDSQYFKEPYVLSDTYTPFMDTSIGREERLRIYLTDTHFEKIKFFIKNTEHVSVDNWSTAHGVIPGGVPLTSARNALNYLRKIFKERARTNPDYEVLVYTIKNTILKKFDYSVVRIICTALYSLYLNENFAKPDHPRLKEFVINKGLHKVAKLNIWPHPFP